MKQFYYLLFIVSSIVFSAQAYASAAGKTIIARGDVKAVNANEERKLKRRSPVFDIDTVTTGAKSRAQLRMSDGGMVALQENTQLEIAKYEYDAEVNKGSAVMNLISGGIRTVTGKLKSENGDYQLNTPVGSIGIRGTHYEVELIGGELFVAVWDGAIDLELNVGGNDVSLSLGDNAEFDYVKISPDGEVTTFTEIPDNFQDGHSSQAQTTDEDDNQDDGSDEEQVATNNTDTELPSGSHSTGDGTDDTEQSNEQNSDEQGEQIATETVTGEVEGTEQDVIESIGEYEDITITNVEEDVEDIPFEAIEDELNDIGTPEEDFIADRTGIADFSNLLAHSIQSTRGDVSNVSMQMLVNFDDRTVNQGELSFNDNEGEWFAAFNGVINKNALELGVNKASHANRTATGSISAGFVNSGNILGVVELREQTNSGVSAGGGFELGERN